MKQKKKSVKKPEPKLRMHTRGFPVWIVDGKLVEPERQVADYLSAMFAHVNSSGEVALQANLEVKILTKAE